MCHNFCLGGNFAISLQEDWIGTQGISISLCLLTLFAGIPLLGAAGRNPGLRHQNLQEDWIGTQGISINLC